MSEFQSDSFWNYGKKVACYGKNEFVGAVRARFDVFLCKTRVKQKACVWWACKLAGVAQDPVVDQYKHSILVQTDFKIMHHRWQNPHVWYMYIYIFWACWSRVTVPYHSVMLLLYSFVSFNMFGIILVNVGNYPALCRELCGCVVLLWSFVLASICLVLFSL